MSQYAYPIEPEWSSEEIIAVVEFLSLIEQAYHEGVSSQELEKKYKAFQEVVRSISGEKRIGRAFARSSGYEIYPVIKRLKEQEVEGRIKL